MGTGSFFNSDSRLSLTVAQAAAILGSAVGVVVAIIAGTVFVYGCYRDLKEGQDSTEKRLSRIEAVLEAHPLASNTQFYGPMP